MADVELYPFATIGDYSGESYPDWIRALDDANGVYVIRERDSREIVYIGESHSDRLYSTLTRHFQQWTGAYNTAGPTYERADIEVAIILVPDLHAPYLQNELICVFAPRDNRLLCEALFPADREDEPPRGYRYDIPALIEGLFYEYQPDEDIPF